MTTGETITNRILNARVAHDPVMPLDMQEVCRRLQQIQEALDLLIKQRPTKDFYSTDEVAEILGKAPFTVREWARMQRVRAEKRLCGRGRSREWMVSKEELERIRSQGLLPRK